MRNLAISSGIWNYVEPAYLTPTWVHFDERWVSTAYPVTRQGSRGNYVCIAQDSLSTLGYDTGGLDGLFGTKSHNAVLAYQRKKGLTADGILGPTSWLSLMNDVVGKGSTSTTIKSI